MADTTGQRRYWRAARRSWRIAPVGLDNGRWRDRRRWRWLFRVRFQTNAGSLGRHEGFGTASECPAPRPSVVCDRALGNDATIGVDANLALDPVVSDLDKPADGRLGRDRSNLPVGISDRLDEG
jgi:hypothetical protein